MWDLAIQHDIQTFSDILRIIYILEKYISSQSSLYLKYFVHKAMYGTKQIIDFVYITTKPVEMNLSAVLCVKLSSQLK